MDAARESAPFLPLGWEVTFLPRSTLKGDIFVSVLELKRQAKKGVSCLFRTEVLKLVNLSVGAKIWVIFSLDTMCQILTKAKSNSGL